ncbi:endonuclease/exonuclease/phosphatase family metal-dependent hydrolase [Rhizobium sp. BK181]|uniref:endonuclease/exonuclease/phosphatase family protein n=1 Tax=Rhizobium sp. BK181 TaxID=2587072 RepID=UPI0016106230|nr:endonuclease/exonuclease/phosphatase family protein [Rhizobium sp. BK181]MBB3317600.1 endonuclease/exonuclease/phosphatase family metal-dependent hydrolase [Rhizobium sp. BK181]
MSIESASLPAPLRGLRILTYNVHSCIGTDRRLDPNRIAEVIAQSKADIIALQELDVGRKRTGGIDQAQTIASLLKMESHFHPALHVREERYGDAILTALPTKLVRAGSLPSVGETRGAIWAEVTAQGHRLNVINTHLGLRAGDRRRQVSTLLGENWMGSAAFRALPAIICGDLNAVGSSAAYRHLAQHFQDAQLMAPRKPRPTFPSRFPLLRLDHIFVSEGFGVTASEIQTNLLARQASDHLPLMVELDLQRSG